jgi:hypothetical protein
LAVALNFTGSCDEAVDIADEVLTNARGNTVLESFALVARAWAYRDSDPAKAYDALGQALTKARASGNHSIKSTGHANSLSTRRRKSPQNPCDLGAFAFPSLRGSPARAREAT